MTNLCRCGAPLTEPHPCHGYFYKCKKPAKRRFYNLKPAQIAGSQLKLSASDTWACDECWADFQIKLKEANIK